MVTKATAPMKAGVIGCGNISSAYFESFSERYGNVEVVACSDSYPERARAAAKQFGIPAALTVEELLASPGVEVVVNLTIPASHAEVSLAALNAGKHVYSEKPLAVERSDGRAILDAAEARGLSVGCAPDTVLGAGIQTCRKLIDEGRIGEPVAATAFMMSPGPESWHPDPEFYYKAGGGPMFDMGPYYLSALVTLLGPVSRVTGSHRKSFRRGARSRACRKRGRRSRWRCRHTLRVCSTSLRARSGRSSLASTCKGRVCRGSRCTGPRGRSACRTRTGSTGP